MKSKGIFSTFGKIDNEFNKILSMCSTHINFSHKKYNQWRIIHPNIYDARMMTNSSSGIVFYFGLYEESDIEMMQRLGRDTIIYATYNPKEIEKYAIAKYTVSKCKFQYMGEKRKMDMFFFLLKNIKKEQIFKHKKEATFEGFIEAANMDFVPYEIKDNKISAYGWYCEEYGYTKISYPISIEETDTIESIMEKIKTIQKNKQTMDVSVALSHLYKYYAMYI